MQAIILAAGMGKRLKKLTQNNTKCMVRVNGVALIERMLSQIIRHDIDRIIIVVGYEGEKLINFVSSLNINVPIIFVNNPVYYETNNIYSLYLAKDYLKEDDTILFESDLIFEDSVLDSIINDNRDTLALVDKYESWMDGTCVILSEEDTIIKFVPGNKFDFQEADRYYKTVNIYKFSKNFSENVYIPFLIAYISALGNNEYYEQVLKVLTLLDNPQIFAKRLNGEKWYEIDDIQDLDIAETLFSENDKKYVYNIQNRYGGYWRFPFVVDFCYPQNVFFPPKRCMDELTASNSRILKNYPSGQSVMRLLASKDMNVAEDNILITNGIEESVYILLNSISGNIGVVAPFYEYIFDVLKDRAIIFRNEDELSCDVNIVIDYFSKKDISALIISNPNYHTGLVINEDDISKLLLWAKEREIYIIVDETYIDFSKSAVSLFNENQINCNNYLILLKNISVPFGVPGLRIGCIALSNFEMINKFQKMIPCWNIDSYAEFFLQIIGKYNKDFSNSIDVCRKERDYIINELKKINGLSVIESESCFVLIELVNGISSDILVRELLSRYNILIKDASSRVSNSDRQYIKITVRNHDENNYLINSIKQIFDEITRIKDVEIEICDTRNFFDNRVKKDLPHRYNFVIYQDSSPELAIQRDIFEKDKISPLLSVKDNSFVLDIGCGVGRWGDFFKTIINKGFYIGLDFSESLLDIAKKQFENLNNFVFKKGAFQDLCKIIKEESLPVKYDIILINGVLMYINDSELPVCLSSLKEILSENGVIYIKESICNEKRLTLNHFYSKEMKSEYSAIYRNVEDYENLFKKYIFSKSYSYVSKGFMWNKELSNRSETASYYWVIKNEKK